MTQYEEWQALFADTTSLTPLSKKDLFDNGNENNTSFRDHVYQFDVTKIAVKTPYDEITLSKYLLDQVVYAYFDKTTSVPTAAFQALYDNHTRGHVLPMDQDHKNKMRDLVYYVLENIVNGLPSRARPEYYVRWRQFRTLSRGTV